MNYNNKKFRVFENSENGETTTETIFEYKQNGNILTSNYNGGQIISGHLIGLVDDNGKIDSMLLGEVTNNDYNCSIGK